MKDLNLIVKFRIDAGARCRVRSAARIRVADDSLTFVDPFTGAAETFPLARIEVLSIQPLPGAHHGLQPV